MSTEQKDDRLKALAQIGHVLLTIQSTERVIKEALVYVIREPGVKTFSKAIDSGKNLDRHTAGQLKTVLMKRVSVSSDFENVLKEFVDERAKFVHRLREVEGFDLDTIEGRLAIISYVTRLRKLCDKVMRVFISLLVDWAETAGMSPEKVNDMRTELGEDWLGKWATVLHPLGK